MIKFQGQILVSNLNLKFHDQISVLNFMIKFQGKISILIYRISGSNSKIEFQRQF